MSNPTQYKWRKGFQARTEADIARAEFERIRGKAGALTAGAIVDESRPDDAALHPEFEWDDAAAADHYRHYQARTLVRALVPVRIETAEEPAREVPVYTLAQGQDEGAPSYHPTEMVVGRVDLLADAISRLREYADKSSRAVEDLIAVAQKTGAEPDRVARIMLAQQAFAAAAAAVAALH